MIINSAFCPAASQGCRGRHRRREFLGSRLIQGLLLFAGDPNWVANIGEEIQEKTPLESPCGSPAYH